MNLLSNMDSTQSSADNISETTGVSAPAAAVSCSKSTDKSETESDSVDDSSEKTLNKFMNGVTEPKTQETKESDEILEAEEHVNGLDESSESEDHSKTEIIPNSEVDVKKKGTKVDEEEEEINESFEGDNDDVVLKIDGVSTVSVETHNEGKSTEDINVDDESIDLDKSFNDEDDDIEMLDDAAVDKLMETIDCSELTEVDEKMEIEEMKELENATSDSSQSDKVSEIPVEQTSLDIDNEKVKNSSEKLSTSGDEDNKVNEEKDTLDIDDDNVDDSTKKLVISESDKTDIEESVGDTEVGNDDASSESNKILEDGGKVKSVAVEASFVDTDDENADDPSEVANDDTSGTVNISEPGDLDLTNDAYSDSAKHSEIDVDECTILSSDCDGSNEPNKSTKKRTFSSETECSIAKKSKTDETTGNIETENVETKIDVPSKPDSILDTINRVAANKTYPLTFMKSLKGTLSNMTKSNLEELVIQKISEVVTERSYCGDLRKRNKKIEEDLEKWKTKFAVISKQMKEMDMIMRKYLSEVKALENSPGAVPTPLRVTRSVGLQVNLNKVQQQMQQKQQPPRGPQYLQQQQQQQQQQQSLSSKSIFTNNPNPFHNYKYAGPAVLNRVRPQNSNLVNGKIPQKPGLNNSIQQRYLVCAQPNGGTNKSPIIQQRTNQQAIPNARSKMVDLTSDNRSPYRAAGSSGQSNPPANNITYLVPTNNRQVMMSSASSTSQNGPSRMPNLLYKGQIPVNSPRPQLFMRPQQSSTALVKHPAPLPASPRQDMRPSWKAIPPRPSLKISKSPTGIVLSWNMNITPEHAPIKSYDLYAYQESKAAPQTALWKRVGQVNALPLPMACTLSQFIAGHRYHFAIRAVDAYARVGSFSVPGSIFLPK